MTARTCNKHGTPEYCPDGVCRWCEPEYREGTEFVAEGSRPLTSTELRQLADKAISDATSLLGLPANTLSMIDRLKRLYPSVKP